MTKTIPVNWKHVGSRIVNYFTTFPQGYYKGVADQIVSGPHYPYPKYVWSFTGGWWPHPANWKRNTALAFGASGAVAAYINSSAHENGCIVSETDLIRDFKATGPIYSSYAGYDSKSHPVQHQ